MKTKFKRANTIILLVVALLLPILSLAQDEVAMSTSPNGLEEQILRHKGFIVSYNQLRLTPNWVAWELTGEEASAKIASRTDEFFPDPDVTGFNASTGDYSRSGYSRGHMAPAADMKWSKVAMMESFYLSNICPQLPRLNDGLWLELEQKCRYWAKKFGPIYIVCGPIYISSPGQTIGANEVYVPDAFFKVVLQKRDGEWCSAGWIIPNIEGMIERPLGSFISTVSGISMITGIQFFNGAPDAAKQCLGRVNREIWEIASWKKR